jgi:hypothetical protein
MTHAAPSAHRDASPCPYAATLAFLALVTGCGAPSPRPADEVPSRPRDSLALTAPGGVEVWFIATRPAKDSAGTPCVERAMEIRRDGGRVAIPLLYTGEAPTLVDDSTLRAHLWLHCRPMRLYEVNLRTGRPVPK